MEGRKEKGYLGGLPLSRLTVPSPANFSMVATAYVQMAGSHSIKLRQKPSPQVLGTKLVFIGIGNKWCGFSRK